MVKWTIFGEILPGSVRKKYFYLSANLLFGLNVDGALKLIDGLLYDVHA